MSLHYPHGTVPIPAPCECRRTRNAPVHMRMDFMEKLRLVIRQHPEMFSSEDVAYTCFCRRCKKIAEATAGMSGLVDPSTLLGLIEQPSS